MQCSVLSPSEEPILGSATEDSKTPGSHKDQSRTAAVSLRINVNSGTCHTKNIVQHSKKPVTEVSIILFKKSSFHDKFSIIHD